MLFKLTMFRQKFTKHKISKVYGAGFADWLFKSEAEKVSELESLIAYKLESEIADDDKYENKYLKYVPTRREIKVSNLSENKSINFYLYYTIEGDPFTLYRELFNLSPLENYPIVNRVEFLRIKKEDALYLKVEDYGLWR